MKLLKLILTVVFLLLAQSSFAATYYMRADGTAAAKEDATSCSAASTAMTIATHDADNTFSAGDIITFCGDSVGGIHRAQMDIPVSGSSGSVITYNCASSPCTISGADLDDKVTGWTGPDVNGEYYKTYATEPKVIIGDGATLTKGTVGSLAATEWVYSGTELYLGQIPAAYTTLEVGQREACIHTNNKDYITITGLVLKGANPPDNTSEGGGIFVKNDSNHIDITNVIISNCYGSGIRIIGADYITITNPVISWITNNSEAPATMGDGIVVLWLVATQETPTNITITNPNISSFIERHAIKIQDADTLEINGGLITDGRWAVNMEPNSGTNEAILNANIHGIKVDKSHASINGGISSTGVNSSNVSIYNNIIDLNDANLDDSALYAGDAGSSTTFYNNTLYGYGYGFYSASVALTATLKNNIFGDATPARRHIRCGAGGTCTLNYNLYASDGADFFHWLGSNYTFANYRTASSQDTNSPTPSDPLFVNVSGGDFSLRANSPAIDAGVNLGSSYKYGLHPYSMPPNSILVNQDDYGQGWEMGSYVYMGRRVKDKQMIPFKIMPFEVRPASQEMNKVNVD